MDKLFVNELFDALEEIKEYREHKDNKHANQYLRAELAPLLDKLMSHERHSIRGRGLDLRENFSIELAERHISAILRLLTMRRPWRKNPLRRCAPPGETE